MKIALIQSPLIWGNVDANLDHFDRKISRCTDCDLILLPEMFVSGCMMVKKAPETAEREKSAVADRYEQVKRQMLAWAAQQDAAVIGSTVYREGKRYYNRLLAAFPEGRYLSYDKRHCFRLGGENEHFSAGNHRLVFDFRGMRIAAFVCYDLRFPVWCRNTDAYDLAVYIANWPTSRREVWKTLLQARAIENQAYVAGVNCIGIDNNGLKYSGDSILLDARGQTVCSAKEDRDEIAYGEADLKQLKEFRSKFPVLDDRDEFTLLL